VFSRICCSRYARCNRSTLALGA